MELEKEALAQLTVTLALQGMFAEKELMTFKNIHAQQETTALLVLQNLLSVLPEHTILKQMQ